MVSFLKSYPAKIYGAISILTLAIFTQAAADTIAIMGGLDLSPSAPPYTALISSTGEVTPLTFLGTGDIVSVSMNSSGNSLIGGQDGTGPVFAAIISPLGAVTPLQFTGPITLHGIINSVAINTSGNGIIGGRDTTGPIYAALVPPSGNPLLPLTFPSPILAGGIINSVAINDSGTSLIGGQGFYNAQPAYAAFASPSGIITPLTLTGGVATSGTITSVSINSSGNALIGGQDQTINSGYAALVSSGTVTPLTLTGGISMMGVIYSVAINDSGNGIIGGQDLTNSQPAYAALLSSGTVTPLALAGGISINGIINSVAINDSGNGIIGGQDLTNSQPAYAALLSSTGTVTPLTLTGNVAINGNILSVSINSDGNAIIGGQDLTGSQPAYAALVLPTGTVIPLTLTGGIANNGWINSVSIPTLFTMTTHIPTDSLSGNNLAFANYINKFAPENAFYFIPATLDGTLNTALQSAAPTRNAVSIYTASNNLFNLTTSFSNYIRNQQAEKLPKASNAIAKNVLASEDLLASLCLPKKATKNTAPLLDLPYSIWFEAIGVLAYQKKQHQTVAFNPTTGGAILAFDRMIKQQWRLGGGVSYLYTHIHEKQGQGHSNINQEEAFIYSSWDNQQFYLDLLLMGGAVQISQVRNTIMHSFSFSSSSHPNGWQLLPHLELGYKKNIVNPCKTTQFCFNPFAMLDWANAWQGSYKEHGDSPFNTSQKSYYGSLLRIEAGLRFYETFFFTSYNFSIQEKISYVNTQSFNAGRVNAFLVGSPGSFTVETLSSAQNLGVAQLALSFDPLNARYPTTTLFYQGEFGSQYQSHQLNIEFGWHF